MKILCTLSMLLLLPALTAGQVACYNYGVMLSCDSPSGNTLITPFTREQGMIQQRDAERTTVTPYTIIPVQPRVEHDLNRVIEPLELLPDLETPPDLDLPPWGLP